VRAREPPRWLRVSGALGPTRMHRRRCCRRRRRSRRRYRSVGRVAVLVLYTVFGTPSEKPIIARARRD